MLHSSCRKIAQKMWTNGNSWNDMQRFQHIRIPKSRASTKPTIQKIRIGHTKKRKEIEGMKSVWKLAKLLSINRILNWMLCWNIYKLDDFQNARRCFQIARIDDQCSGCGCFGGGYTHSLLLWHLGIVFVLFFTAVFDSNFTMFYK